MEPAGRLDYVDLYAAERGELLGLLRDLKPDEWQLPTECPAWSVKGIVLHLLGDDLSILSRQRDGEPSRVAIEGAGNWDALFAALDRHNERWVDATFELSVSLLFELLALAGEWTQRWYATEPGWLGEPIPWIGPDASPKWLLCAREYLERWIHHQQIRRATGRPDWFDPSWAVPAIAVGMRGFPQGFAILPASDGATVTFSLDEGTAWTVRRDGEVWNLYDGAPTDPAVRFPLDVGTASLLFSRGLTKAGLSERLRPEGDSDLGSLVVAGLAAFFGRDD